ncbi:MAG: hypothetical protein M0R06_06535 [Sphaerochaeta sp.]|nr:hypothetical protein [Sphaerochaeta sp.]MDD4986240.1 hypothetical protein [Dehalococcoidales bacterium]
MTDPHDPKSARSSQKPADAFQWGLDQELAGHTSNSPELHNDSTSSSPHTPFTRRESGYISKNISNINTSLSLSPPIVPLSLSQPAASADPETVQDIKSWMKAYRINCINYLLRHHTVSELNQAAEDFEEAVTQGVNIRNPSGFFRSLLK